MLFRSCLHRILERLDLNAERGGPLGPALVERELRRAGLDSDWATSLLEGLEQMRTTPLGGPLGELRVADLAPSQRLHEMHFDLTLASVRARAIAAAFRSTPGGFVHASYAAALAQLPINHRGFLTGSIDMVFQAVSQRPGGDGRWWVADWKSNWLGSLDEDGRPLACGPRHYNQPAMQALMEASHYPLQAHLYLVALHRYLAWRLPGYSPERDLGGYAYVFLRGLPGPLPAMSPIPGIVLEQPPLGRILALDGLLREGTP